MRSGKKSSLSSAVPSNPFLEPSAGIVFDNLRSFLGHLHSVRLYTTLTHLDPKPPAGWCKTSLVFVGVLRKWDTNISTLMSELVGGLYLKVTYLSPTLPVNPKEVWKRVQQEFTQMVLWLPWWISTVVPCRNLPMVPCVHRYASGYRGAALPLSLGSGEL